jgi:hypothetical protein
VEVREHEAEFRRRGAEIVALAQGTGDEAARLCRDLGVASRCLGDPEKAAYRSFGLVRDGWWNVTGRPFFEEPRLAFRRIRKASLRGSLHPSSDVLQLGGIAVVDRSGTLRYLHRSRRTDDLPAMSELLDRL